MSVKNTRRKQYIRLIEQSAQQIGTVTCPKEGWIATVRHALAMSGAQLARRMGVTRAAIYQAEHNELNGSMTLKHMEKIAQSLGGKVVYAIVLDKPVEDCFREQAQIKAESLIQRASAHMALEKQSLPLEVLHKEIERFAEEMIRDMPPDFWDKP